MGSQKIAIFSNICFMTNLKFSILIPAYNGAEVIGDTLRSILSQSFSNYEIIIQDDASTDNTEEVVKSFGDPRIKFFRNEKNLGYPGNLEEARKKADGRHYLSHGAG